ncbi:MAG: DMT family transporter [Enterobacteriaceae bacterium]
MKRFYIIGFLALMLVDTFAQISFKAAANHALPLSFDLEWMLRIFGNIWIYGAFLGYITTFFIWMILLRHAPVGPSFAASHMEIISVNLFSVWLFNEPMTVPKVVGGLLILAGVLCLAKSKSKPEEEQGPVVKSIQPVREL